MKNTLLLLLNLAIITRLYAQHKVDDDNLKPVNGIFSEYNFQFDYYSLVRKILFTGFSDNPEVGFVIIPSFTPESALDIEIENNSDNKKYFLQYHKADPSIWYNRGKKKIHVDSIKAEIDYNSFLLVKNLFLSAINKVKYQTDSLRSVGFDGTTYYFSASDMGQKDGVIWSPTDGTKMARLVEVAIHLTELMQEKSDLISFDVTFSKEIKDLIEQIIKGF